MMQPSPDNFSFVPDKYTTRTVEKQLGPKEFTEKYIESPIYKDRLSSSGYTNVNDEIKNRLNRVKKTNTVYQSGTPSWDKQVYNDIHNIPYTEGFSGSNFPGNIVVDTKEAKKLNVPISSIEVHEYGHKETDTDGNALNEKDSNELNNRLLPDFKNKDMHDSWKEENKSDMNTLRYELYQKGIDVLNKPIEQKHLDMIKSMKSSGGKRFLEHYSNKDALWLLNNVAKNNQSDQLPDNFLNNNIT